MSGLEEFADALQKDVLMEMAESFFGERKSIDDDKDLFFEKAETVKKIGWSAIAKAGLLHALLLDNDAAPDFYRALGIVPKRLFALVDPKAARLFVRMPRSLSRKKRYEKLLVRVYGAVAEAFHTYLHGRLLADPRKPGRKRLSLHYHLLKDWCDHINNRVRHVNESQAPSCVLGMAKSMNPASLEKESISGATLNGYATSLDAEMALKGVDCTEAGLIELPELPPLAEVKPRIRQFAKKLYPANKARIKAIIKRVSKNPIRLPNVVE